jgi:hypothetical protein
MKLQCDKKADKRAHKISQDKTSGGQDTAALFCGKRLVKWKFIHSATAMALIHSSYQQLSVRATLPFFSISVLDISLAFMHRGVAAAHLNFRFESRGTLQK